MATLEEYQSALRIVGLPEKKVEIIKDIPKWAQEMNTKAITNQILIQIGADYHNNTGYTHDRNKDRLKSGEKMRIQATKETDGSTYSWFDKKIENAIETLKEHDPKYEIQSTTSRGVYDKAYTEPWMVRIVNGLKKIPVVTIVAFVPAILNGLNMIGKNLINYAAGLSDKLTGLDLKGEFESRFLPRDNITLNEAWQKKIDVIAQSTPKDKNVTSTSMPKLGSLAPPVNNTVVKKNDISLYR